MKFSLKDPVLFYLLNQLGTERLLLMPRISCRLEYFHPLVRKAGLPMMTIPFLPKRQNPTAIIILYISFAAIRKCLKSGLHT